MKKFKIDISFIITIIVILFSPYQKIILPFFISLVIHELGHIIMAVIFKIKINCLKLTIFGMYLDVDTYKLNIKNELLLYLGGIIFNLLSLLIFRDSYRNFTLLIILFNILPIYPLDGFRVLKTIFSYFFSYKRSLIITSIISIIVSILVLIYKLKEADYLILFNIIYLILINLLELINVRYAYQTFLLDKYLNRYNHKKRFIKFNEYLINRLFRFHSIYTFLGDIIIDENDLLDLHYRNF